MADVIPCYTNIYWLLLFIYIASHILPTKKNTTCKNIGSSSYIRLYTSSITQKYGYCWGGAKGWRLDAVDRGAGHCDLEKKDVVGYRMGWDGMDMNNTIT